ncbi:MAG: PDZ domain-containing protein [Bacteroidales bacterium]|nr:PDZ domain-containing protein [Bacteroidales bacterium]
MDDRKRGRLSLALWLFMLLLICSMYVGKCSRGRKELAVDDHKWSKLLLVLDQIEKNYVDTIDYKDMVEKLLPQVMEKLDPHSVYLPPVELEAADESLVGNFSGIGIQFNVPADTAIVISVIQGGPSEKAGLLSGDRIIKVDGKMVAGVKMNQDSLVKMLKGPRGTKVHLEVKRDNLDELLPFEIVRDKIPVKSVDVAFMLSDSLGYVKLSKFSRTSYVEFMEAVLPLVEQGMKELVFDLRDNTGGYLDQALRLSNEFLDEGELIVYMEGANRAREDYKASGKGLLRDMKLYVLINESSASSSEIFAGAIQDNDRGTILGRRSYGKGLVQEPVYFTDKSGIRLTVARFYTPTGRCIQKPYDENYQMDIIERYRHGEMISADSIRRVDSLKYTTPGGKVVYGGGGIIPDIFVPIDTTGVTDFLIACNRKSLIVKFSNILADKYRKELRKVETFEDLERLVATIDIGGEFLEYARRNGVVPGKGEWKESREIVELQLCGLMGRYTVLDDNAFYPYILRLDNVIDKVKEVRNEY